MTRLRHERSSPTRLVTWRAERSSKRFDAKDDALDVKSSVSARADDAEAAEQASAGTGANDDGTRCSAALRVASGRVIRCCDVSCAVRGAVISSREAAGEPGAACEGCRDLVLDCEARFLRGDALRSQAEQDKAKPGALQEQSVAAYRAYLAAREHGRHKRPRSFIPRRCSISWVGRRKRRFGDGCISKPDGSGIDAAARRLEQPGTGKRRFSASELIERAQVLSDEMRNPESEAAFLLVLEQPDPDDKQKCIARYHLAQSVFKQRQRPRARRCLIWR